MICDRSVVKVGLAVMLAGGDFADGAIAAAGIANGAEAFVSFDRRAVRLLRAEGLQAIVPA